MHDDHLKQTYRAIFSNGVQVRMRKLHPVAHAWTIEWEKDGEQGSHSGFTALREQAIAEQKQWQNKVINQGKSITYSEITYARRLTVERIPTPRRSPKYPHTSA